MYEPAELVLKSYKPLFLEKGMYFITKLNPGTRKEHVELWQLDSIPQDMEGFLVQNGYPVELQIVIDDVVMASHENIGWFDAGEDTDELYDITLKELNTILADYDGHLEIEVKTTELDNENEIAGAVVYDNKVTLRYPTEEEEDEYVTDLDVWTEGKKLDYEYISIDGESAIEHCVKYNDQLWSVITDLNRDPLYPYSPAELHEDDDDYGKEDNEGCPNYDDWAEDDMDDDSWKED